MFEEGKAKGRKIVIKEFPAYHLLHWLSKITDICSGRIDEFNVSKPTLPKILCDIQNGAKIMDVLSAKKYTKQTLKKRLKTLGISLEQLHMKRKALFQFGQLLT